MVEPRAFAASAWRWATGAAPAWITAGSLRWLLRLVIVAAAAAQAWWFRDTGVPDGVSYLDVGDAFVRGDWHTALSTYWSPLFSLMLGLGNAIVHPGPELEWAVAHAVTFTALLVALAAFELLVSAVLAPARGAAATPTTGDLLVVFTAYSLFAGGSLTMASVGLVTADPLALAAACLLGALVERLRVRGVTTGRALGLGAAAGAAVLAKAVMLPVGALVVLASWTVLGRGRSRARAVALVAAAFVVTSGAYVGALSLAHGRLTAGDTGRLNYAWLVNGVRPYGNYQGEDGRHGTLQHPTRLVTAAPRAFEFATPVGGTYPVWLDPGYWYEGVAVGLDPAQEWAAVQRNVAPIRDEVLANRSLLAVLVALLFAAALDGSARRRMAAGLRARAALLLPALGGLAAYLLTAVEVRYVPPFLLLLLVPVAAALATDRPVSRLAVLVFVIAVLVGWPDVYAPRMRETQVTDYAAIARRLHGLGLEPGDRVAFIGHSFGASCWARLGRLRLVAEVPQDEAPAFWTADPAIQESVLAAFRRAGARAVLTGPASAVAAPWIRVGRTSAYYRWLEPRGGPP